MHKAEVEIYSDETNRAILRHPGRKFPGVLVQGDSLYGLCKRADDICASARDGLDALAFEELNGLRNSLWSYLTHYKSVLTEHGIEMPFNETP